MSAAAGGNVLQPLHGNFVMLRAGTLRLLLRQEEVGAAEHVELATQGRFMRTRLHTDGGELSLEWDEARVLIDARLELTPLPQVMRLPQATIAGYVELDGELALFTSVRHLAAVMGRNPG